MIVHYDPDTLKQTHVVYRPFPIEYLANLPFGENWVSYPENIPITDFYLEGNPPEVMPMSESQARLDGSVIRDVPAGSKLLFDGEWYDVEGDVELDLEPGTHVLVLRNRKHYDKTIEVTV